jgi:hypothetical protein
MGKELTPSGIYEIYKMYKEEFLPKLLADPTVPNEDKEKIKVLQNHSIPILEGTQHLRKSLPS